MRSIASCYNEHAVKVSDSYCSGPSHHHSYVISHFPPPNPHKIASFYKPISQFSSKTKSHFSISLIWSITQQPTIKINSVSHKIATPKGTETFRISGSVISMFWDLSEADFDQGPEPTNGFYLIIVMDSEIGLWLGEKGEELIPELGIPIPKSETHVPKFSLVSRNEEFSGEGSVFSSKGRFSEDGRIHDILIKCGGGGGDEGKNRNQVLLVMIDKKKIFEVNRLRWNFRGNQTIFIDGKVVDMLWDVYEWFFKPQSGFGVFMFRTRSGLDSRLWLEEKREKERVGFSLLIRVCRNPD